MSTTGVVRRIDDLGRIVIPKEIRRSLGIKVGTSLEIIVDNDIISLKKKSSMNNIANFAELYADSVYNATKKVIFITDRDSIIAASGQYRKKYVSKYIGSFLENCIKSGKSINEQYKKKLFLDDEHYEEGCYIIKNIISNGDSIGLVIMLVIDTDIGPIDEKLVEIAVQILGKHIED